jgi:complex III assembly factor LYRM7
MYCNQSSEKMRFGKKCVLGKTSLGRNANLTEFEVFSGFAFRPQCRPKRIFSKDWVSRQIREIEAMSTTAARALSGYRRLFRARSFLFQGDDRALRESRLAIRAEFTKNKNAPPSQIPQLLQMIDDAEDMLLHGIVQGQLNEEKNVVEVKLGPEHESRMDSETMTHLDPITSETGKEMDGRGSKPVIEVTKRSGS